MESNWIAAYALGAGFANPRSVEAVATIATVAAGQAERVLGARAAVASVANVDEETREAAFRLLDAAVAHVRHPSTSPDSERTRGPAGAVLQVVPERGDR